MMQVGCVYGDLTNRLSMRVAISGCALTLDSTKPKLPNGRHYFITRSSSVRLMKVWAKLRGEFIFAILLL
jgi:hypothetical protein